ncbi:hypothetical protein LSPCS325_16060 [Lysinibacillus sp. CTST325]
MRNTIGDVIYISDDSLDELNEESLRNIVNNSSQKCFRYDVDNVLFKRLLLNLTKSKKKIVRYQSLEEHEYEKDQFLESVNDKYTILDLDLDYFNDSDKYNSDSKLKTKDQTVRNLMYLKNLTDWDVITIALSPEYCGGEDECSYLFELFLECFGIDKNELVDW